jgi:hypothetical protein
VAIHKEGREDEEEGREGEGEGGLQRALRTGAAKVRTAASPGPSKSHTHNTRGMLSFLVSRKRPPSLPPSPLPWVLQAMRPMPILGEGLVRSGLREGREGGREGWKESSWEECCWVYATKVLVRGFLILLVLLLLLAVVVAAPAAGGGCC